jgi:hypothetical protein
MVRVPSPFFAAALDEELLELSDALSLSLPLPQAVSASDAVARSAAVRQARVGRIMEPP